jgi:hypothetical protein
VRTTRPTTAPEIDLLNKVGPLRGVDAVIAPSINNDTKRHIANVNSSKGAMKTGYLAQLVRLWAHGALVLNAQQQLVTNARIAKALTDNGIDIQAIGSSQGYGRGKRKRSVSSRGRGKGSNKRHRHHHHY